MSIDQHILVTVDAVIFGMEGDHKTHLLLVQRKNDPFKGHWSFPGGFVEDDEDLPRACVRELEEETGLSLSMDQLYQIGAFGKPGRDPRGRTVTVAFYGETVKHEVKGADDAAQAKWWPLDELPALAFDHEDILKVILN